MNIGVIFDFDGVLIDSLDRLFCLYFSVANKYSDDVSEFDIEKLNGKNVLEICEYIRDQYAQEAEVAAIKKIYDNELFRIYSELDVSEFWRDVLIRLNGKVEMAIASGCDSKLIEMVLKRNGLRQYFKAVVGGDMVKQAKPSSEIVQLSLKKCCWDDAVVIDDSYNGIKAGLAAGCSVLKYDHKLKGNDNIIQIITLSLFCKFSYLGCINSLNIKVSSSDSPVYSDNENLEWELIEKNGAYNDSLMCINSILDFDVNCLNIFESEYKRFRLGCKYPAIAVTGIVKNIMSNILFAKRNEGNFQNVNCNDLVPSGSLAINDINGQLNEEWFEESNSNICLKWESGCSFVFDHASNVVDIVKVSENNDFNIDEMQSLEVRNFNWIDVINFNDENLANSAKFIVAIVGE